MTFWHDALMIMHGFWLSDLKDIFQVVKQEFNINLPTIQFEDDWWDKDLDYFTEEIMGEAQLSRADYTASADDNVLVQGITGDKGSLGYFGYSYYRENEDKLKLVAVDSGSGCVSPSLETIPSGEYSPLSRPLFIYVNLGSLVRPEVKAFVDFYMEHGPALTNEVGYVASDDSVYAENKAKLE